MSHKPKGIFSLKFREYPLLVEIWLTLAWVDLVIRFFPYERWRHWFDGDDKGHRPLPKEFDIAALINLSERVARHHLCAMNCLRRTLAQKKMLARRGVSACIHIGVKKGDSGFEAHSWLSCNGRVLNDSADVAERYVELARDQWRNVKLFGDEQ